VSDDLVKGRKDCQMMDGRWFELDEQRVTDRRDVDEPQSLYRVVDDIYIARESSQPASEIYRVCRQCLSHVIEDDAGNCCCSVFQLLLLLDNHRLSNIDASDFVEVNIP